MPFGLWNGWHNKYCRFWNRPHGIEKPFRLPSKETEIEWKSQSSTPLKWTTGCVNKFWMYAIAQILFRFQNVNSDFLNIEVSLFLKFKQWIQNTVSNKTCWCRNTLYYWLLTLNWARDVWEQKPGSLSSDSSRIRKNLVWNTKISLTFLYICSMSP